MTSLFSLREHIRALLEKAQIDDTQHANCTQFLQPDKNQFNGTYWLDTRTAVVVQVTKVEYPPR